jgi:bacillolysin
MKPRFAIVLVFYLFAATCVLNAQQRQMIDPRPLPPIPTPQASTNWLPQKTAGFSSSNLKSGAVHRGSALLTPANISDWDGITVNKYSDESILFSSQTPSQQGVSTWISVRPNTYKIPAKQTANDTLFTAGVVLGLLDLYASELGLTKPSDELKLTKITNDELGFQQVRFEQRFNGVPVWGSELIVHTNYDGAIFQVNGTIQHTPDLELNYAFDSKEVIYRMKSLLTSEGLEMDFPNVYQRWLGIAQPTANAYVYVTEEGARSVYELKYHAGMSHRETVIMDAQTGEILNRINQICSMDHILSKLDLPTSPEKGINTSTGLTPFRPDYTQNLSGTFQNANGTDLMGQNKTFRTYRDPSGTYLMLWDLPNMNKAQSSLSSEIIGGQFLLTANGKDITPNTDLFFVASENNTWPNQTSVSAYVNATITFDYFRTVHNRNSFDDKGTSMISIIHVTNQGKPMDNAFWSGRFMAYGDGDQVFLPFAKSLDVAGHEMSHGVIEFTANLVYQFQPGALNESMADVFGMFVERRNYLMGEDIMKPGFGVALRDMENPGSSQLFQAFRQPAHMSEYQQMSANEDNGGVHVNSGIPNRAAIIIVKAIGAEKTEKIYYRALKNYMTKSSQFLDGRRAIIQAAADLHGSNSQEVNVVRQAFNTVGITDTSENPNPNPNPNPDPNPPPPPSPGDDDDEGPAPTVPPVPPIKGERNLVAVVTSDGRIGILDLTNPLPTFGIIENPAARVRVDQQTADIAQITTTVRGRELWFINQNFKLGYVDLSDMQVYEFPNLYLFSPGDLWNASIDPTGSYVALVSGYINDATMYIYNGEQIASIPLEPESTGRGVNTHTILYPDVFAWSPNPDVPKIAFDALNKLNLRSGSSEYWSIFEIDFQISKIYNLVPAQPSSVSIGNINYSSRRTDWITFNTMTAQNTDIVVANFEQGVVAPLDLPSFNLTDSWRPSFSPDDRFLTFTSPSNTALLFYNFANQEVTALNIGVAAYNTLWFLYNGNYVTSSNDDELADLPQKAVLHPAYPNPFNPATTISFDLPSSDHINVKLYDVTGRLVRTVVSAQHQAGQHRLQIDAAGLSSGVYLIRLEGSFGVLTNKVTLLK